MGTLVSRLPMPVRMRALVSARATVLVGLAALVALSAMLRTRQMDVGFWIDEGLSVGIASFPLTEIPGALRLDGSPPLYYMLLKGWMELAGRTETATHTFSLIFVLSSIPIAFWAARSLFGTRAGWLAAAFFAFNPFLTDYAQETRMYGLVALLSLVASVALVRLLVVGEGRMLVPAVLSLAALLYTHNWALFFGAAAGGAWIALLILEPARRPQRLRHGLVAFGGALALYAPWIPTMLHQAAHTGAPWSRTPGPDILILQAPERMFGSQTAYAVIALIVGAGFVHMFAGTRWRESLDSAREGGERRQAVLYLLALCAGTLTLAWVSSQASPTWANRYFAVAVPPLLLCCAVGFAVNRSRMAVAGLAIVGALWFTHDAPRVKSNVRTVAAKVDPYVYPGDLVISTQPESVSVLSYYLGQDKTYATLTGPVPTTRVTDWTDGVDRLRNTSPERDLRPLLDAVPNGGRVLLVTPIVYDQRRWRAPWTRLVQEKTLQWRAAIAADPRFSRSVISPPSLYPAEPNAVRATLYRKEERQP